MPKIKSLFAVLSLLFAVSAHAAPKSASKPSSMTAGKSKAVDPATLPLDQVAVKSYYGDGDFGPAIAILEDFQKTHSNFSREESLMVYKYLGVMYCADQGTREKGKSYFYKLLKIDPQAKILDMYVSIVVQDIFKGTLDELMGQSSSTSSANGRAGSDADLPKTENDRPRTATLSGKKSHAAYWWIGGLAVAAGVAGGYYLYAASSDDRPKETDIPITP